jgi:hypothetical protein
MLTFVGLIAMPAVGALGLASGQDSAFAAVSANPLAGDHQRGAVAHVLRPMDVSVLSDIPNPAANPSDRPAWSSCARGADMDNSPKCTSVVLTYIDVGRANIGVKPMVAGCFRWRHLRLRCTVLGGGKTELDSSGSANLWAPQRD